MNLICWSLNSYFISIVIQYLVYDTGWLLFSIYNQDQNIDVIRIIFQHIPTCTPLMSDLLQYNCEECWEDSTSEWHLTTLVYNILILFGHCARAFRSKCIEVFPAEYRQWKKHYEIQKIYDELERVKLNEKVQTFFWSIKDASFRYEEVVSSLKNTPLKSFRFKIAYGA